MDFQAQSAPPKPVVMVTGEEPRSYDLAEKSLTLGRSESNDIVIRAATVSCRHARLDEVNGDYQIVVLPEAANPVLLEGRPLSEPYRLGHGDIHRIGRPSPGMMVTLVYQSPSEAAVEGDSLTIKFGEKNQLQIGRDPSNDVVLNVPNVSRYHAQLERIGQRYRLRDLRSSNGTFVHDQRIVGDTWLNSEDTIRIGPYRFVLGEDEIAQYDESGGLQADVLNPQPDMPDDPTDPDEMEKYLQEPDDYEKEIAEIQAAFQAQMNASSDANTVFERGFVAMVAISESGRTSCEFDNAWLWLIEDED